MREKVTTLLDVVGLLLIAAGVAALLLPVAGWGALTAAGVVVLAGSWWATRQGGAAR
ncbi:hypothetical protein [Spongiactinospora sp. TRM90649]|uniref:hypothetical protein n=1 Tax=Spongiactinospora sp. TRM90649 TaxID=3031114 RepID=UPI0023F85904|nr:hypothetical protein [Spongiactinospora sp. TRM90649]MDF5755812.1 hypothetical protein [Spongiactinospora sp. TRM90649]